MIVRPLQREDFARMADRLQPEQAHLRESLSSADYQNCALAGTACAVEKDGEIIFLGGVIEMWPERAMVWSLVSASAASCFLRLTRAVTAFLDDQPYRRIECYVDWDFTAGHRWAALLGFKLEGRMTAFSPRGTDMAMYGRIKNG